MRFAARLLRRRTIPRPSRLLLLGEDRETFDRTARPQLQALLEQLRDFRDVGRVHERIRRVRCDVVANGCRWRGRAEVGDEDLEFGD